jgi:hypothetical protein
MLKSDAVEHFQVRWFRLTVGNAVQGELRFQVRWFGLTVGNAVQGRTGAVSV